MNVHTDKKCCTYNKQSLPDYKSFQLMSLSPSNPSIPHFLPATRQPNTIASLTWSRLDNEWITAPLNVSPAPSVSTNPPRGGNDGEEYNYTIMGNMSHYNYHIGDDLLT